MPLAVQTYTVRNHLKTLDSFAESMRKIAALGYPAVQLSGTGDLAAADMRRVCTDLGLAICATHEHSKDICESPQAVVDRLGVLGCTFTAYPYPHLPISTMAEIESLAAKLDAAGAVLRRAGQTLCYHNHELEFARVNGRSVLDWLYRLTAPANLQGEPDTYWVQAGGEDPVAWCERLADRLPLLHLKDFAIRRTSEGKYETAMADVGHGNLDWQRIIPAATASGCQWFIVENDNPGEDAFAALGRSITYLKTRFPALIP